MWLKTLFEKRHETFSSQTFACGKSYLRWVHFWVNEGECRETSLLAWLFDKTSSVNGAWNCSIDWLALLKMRNFPSCDIDKWFHADIKSVGNLKQFCPFVVVIQIFIIDLVENFHDLTSKFQIGKRQINDDQKLHISMLWCSTSHFIEMGGFACCLQC